MICNDCRAPVAIDDGVPFTWTDEQYPGVAVATMICKQCAKARSGNGLDHDEPDAKSLILPQP